MRIRLLDEDNVGDTTAEMSVSRRILNTGLQFGELVIVKVAVSKEIASCVIARLEETSEMSSCDVRLRQVV